MDFLILFSKVSPLMMRLFNFEDPYEIKSDFQVIGFDENFKHPYRAHELYSSSNFFLTKLFFFTQD